MKTKIFAKIIALTSLLMLNLVWTPVFAAGSLSALSDTMSRVKNSSGATVYSDHTIKFTTPTALTDTTDKIVVTFPAGFTVGSVDFSDIDLTHGASTGTETSEVLAATADATNWGAAFAGQVLTFTHPTNAANGDIAANDKIIIKIGQNATGGTGNLQIANPNTSNTFVITIETFDNVTLTDTGSVAVVTVGNDQVVLSATVDPSITFSLSGNTSTFASSLSPGIVRTAGSVITITVGTNGNGGYQVTVRDQGSGSNPGLYNSLASALIGSADGSYNATADLDSGGVAFGYGLQAACTAGCTTGTHVSSDFRQGSNVVGALTIADKALVTYSSATATDHTITNTYKAKASASTKAGTYTDTLTYIATATF